MGMQSLVFYGMVAWLPSILIQQGLDPGKAGWTLSLMQLANIPIGFAGSVLAGRSSSQRPLAVVGSLFVLTGLFGLLFGGLSLAFLWIIILGIGGGITFSLALMFFTLRTRNADEAAKLSGMAQFLGYLFAALGPMFFGFLHDLTGNWTATLIILIGAATLCMIIGLGASRNLYVTND